jgi:hypothetical protein
VSNHAITVNPFNRSWIAVCACGWSSLPDEIASNTRARAVHHLRVQGEIEPLEAKTIMPDMWLMTIVDGQPFLRKVTLAEASRLQPTDPQPQDRS